jgi:hypothetical protein
MRDMVSSENSETFSISCPPSWSGATLAPELLLEILAGDEDTMPSFTRELIALANASSDIWLKMDGVVDAAAVSLSVVYDVRQNAKVVSEVQVWRRMARGSVRKERSVLDLDLTSSLAQICFCFKEQHAFIFEQISTWSLKEVADAIGLCALQDPAIRKRHDTAMR